MRMLTLSIILIAFPALSHARGYYQRSYDDHFSFWQSIEERQCNQRDLIASGVETGLLTKREIRKLRRQQKHADRKVRHYRKFSHLNYKSQRELMSYLDRVGERIWQLKNNGNYNHHRYNNYHNPFTRNINRWDERNNQHSVRGNWNVDSAEFYFEF